MAGKLALGPNGKIGIGASGKAQPSDCSDCCAGCEECGDSCDNCSGITPQYINATLSGFPDDTDCLCAYFSSFLSISTSQSFDAVDGTYEAVCDSTFPIQPCAGLGSDPCWWGGGYSPGEGTTDRTSHSTTIDCSDTSPATTAFGLQIVINRCNQGSCDTGESRWRVWVGYTNTAAPWDGWIIFYGEACTSDCTSEITINNSLAVNTHTAPGCGSTQTINAPCNCDGTTYDHKLIDWEAGTVTLTPCP